MLRLAIALLALASLPVAAADRLVSVETRPGVRVAYWWMERPDATATVMLLPGGEGGIGMKDGVPRSQNFLVRSRDLFAAAGYNVAIVGKPSDRTDLDPGFRASSDHVADLRRIADKLRNDFGKPVWLVGTSLGTISAAATAIAMDPGEIAGIVLSSSRTGGNYPTVPACPSCNPREAPRIVEALTNAPVKKFILLTGGGGASGPPCEALHYHGYIGMEKEAVETITAWMKDQKDR
jgi:pimeloyl-ACP methyl ester carboxylesterase